MVIDFGIKDLFYLNEVVVEDVENDLKNFSIKLFT